MKCLKVLSLLGMYAVLQSTAILGFINIPMVLHDGNAQTYYWTEAIGRGNTGLADNGGVESVCYNPASLRVDDMVSFVFSKGLNELKYELVDSSEITQFSKDPAKTIFLGAAIQVVSNLFAGISYACNSDLKYGGYLMSEPEETYQLGKNRYEFTLSAAYMFNQYLSIGLSLNSHTLHLNEYHFDHGSLLEEYGFVMHDFSPQLGIQISPTDELTIGASLKQPVDFSIIPLGFSEETTLWVVPRKVSIGLKYKILKGAGSLYMDYSNTEYSRIESILYKDCNTLGIGMEFAILDFLEVRGGYLHKTNFLKPPNLPDVLYNSQDALTAGLTLHNSFAALHIAVLYGSLTNENTNMVSLSGEINL